MSSFQALKDTISEIRKISSDFEEWDRTNFPAGKLGNSSVFDTETACTLFEYFVGIVERALGNEGACVNNVSPGEMIQVGDTLASAAQSLQDSDHSEFVNRIEELIAIARPFEMLPIVQAKDASRFLMTQSKVVRDRVHRASLRLEIMEKKIAAQRATTEEYKEKLTELSAEAAMAEEARRKENEKNVAAFFADRMSSMEKAQKLINSAKQALRLTTAQGLAEAFKEKEEKSGSRWVKGFWLGLSILAAVAAVAIGSGWTLGNAADNSAFYLGTVEFLVVLRHTLMMFVAIGIAGFAGRQYAKNKVIEEDYAYKAALAASFPGFASEFGKPEDAKMREEYISKLLAEILQDPQRERKTEKKKLFIRKRQYPGN